MRQEYQVGPEADEKKGGRVGKEGILSVILLEEKGRFSSSRRIVEVLEAVSLIYSSCGVIHGERSEQQLVVLGCDSGSDKSFDFLGVAKLVECVKDVILSAWDRVVFYRELQLAKRLDLVAQSLPIIEKVGKLQSEGKPGPEQAEILRKDIVGGVQRFISAGAIIPEIEANAEFNPRQLVAPEPKLLAALPSGSSPAAEVSAPTPGGGGAAPGLDGLSSEDQAKILEILGKARKVEPE